MHFNIILGRFDRTIKQDKSPDNSSHHTFAEKSKHHLRDAKQTSLVPASYVQGDIFTKPEHNRSVPGPNSSSVRYEFSDVYPDPKPEKYTAGNGIQSGQTSEQFSSDKRNEPNGLTAKSYSYKRIQSNSMLGIFNEALHSQVQPLDKSTLGYMKSRFGYDFSEVRIHTNHAAAESARAVNARAYAYGGDIIFDSGQYEPATVPGQRLIAHELAHVIQQERGGNSSPYPADNYLESAADQASSAAVYGDSPVRVSGASSPSVARQPRSLAADLNPLTLKDNELEAEVLLINQWLSANSLGSTPETNHMAEVLSSLEQESHRRHNAKAQTKAGTNPTAPTVNPPMPTVKTNDENAIMKAMAEIKGIAPSKTASGLYTIIHDGETHEISLDTVNKIRDKAREDIKEGVSKSRTQAEHAQARYQGQNEVDRRDRWNKAAAYLVKTVGAIRDPGPDLIAEVNEALSKASSAENALEHNNFTRAGQMLSRSESSAIKANMIFEAYFDNIIEAGNMTVTVLTITRDTAFSIAIGIGAALAAPVVATSLAGMGLGTAAVAVGTGATVTVGGAASGGVLRGGTTLTGQILTGDETNWSKTGNEAFEGAKRGGVDALTGVASAGTGHLLKPATSFASSVGKGAISSFVGGTAGGTLEASIKDAHSLEDIREGKVKLNSDVVKEGLKKGLMSIPGGAIGGGSGYMSAGMSSGSRGLVGAASGSLGSGTAAYLAGGTEEDIRNAMIIGVTGGLTAAATTSTIPQSNSKKSQSNSKKSTSTPAAATPEQISTPAAPTSTPAARTSTPAAPAPEQISTPAAPTSTPAAPTSTPAARTSTPAAATSTPAAPTPEQTSTPAVRPSIPKVVTAERRPSGFSGSSGIELDFEPHPERKVPFRELETAGTSVSGSPSNEKGGTEHRKGIYFHEYNAAEMGPPRLRVDYDPVVGRARKITYEVHEDVVRSEALTERSFSRDVSTEGGQPTNRGFKGSGMEKGHMAQREAFKGDRDMERAVDQMTNIVPMMRSMNRGSGSLWRAAESRTAAYVIRGGHRAVVVEIQPIYDDNPPLLSDGTAVPKAVRRTVKTLDGAVLEDISYLNQ